MDSLVALLLTVGVSAGTTALLIALLRVGGPFITKLFGSVIRTRAELDADRDRIIANLRLEIEDWKRRTELSEQRAAAAERESVALRNQLADLNRFIDTLLGRLGTTRAAVESGEPLPGQRRGGR